MKNSERGNSRLRFLDKYVGIPAVMALGLWSRRKNSVNYDTVKRVAFLKTAAIGDTIILSAVVQDFKDAYPDAHLTFFTASSNYEAALLLSGVDKIVKLPVNKPFESIKYIRKSGSYDVWFDFGPWPRINALFSFFSDSRVKIGFKTKGQCRHHVYDIPVEHSNEIHELYNYKNLLRPLNITGTNLPCLEIESSDCVENRITIHMFPGGYKSYLKEWPDGYWIELIDILVGAGYEIYLTGAKSDKNRAAEIINKVRVKNKIHNAAGEMNLVQSARLLQSSKLVISVNTGIMHMASALGCNLVALHGPTSVTRWGPLNRNSVSLQSSTKCSPCLNLGFEYKCSANTCMENILIASTIDAIRTFLPLAEDPEIEKPPTAEGL